MATLTRKWKKLMAVGCSHGNLASATALEAVLRFKEQWKPDFTAHLGDAFDTAAFRAGAAGTADAARSPTPDLEAGLEFLALLRPQLLCKGNHEYRLDVLAQSPNALVATAAQHVRSAIEAQMEEQGTFMLPYDILNGHYTIGGYKYLHGFVYNETACRDNAETWGNCVFAHTHQAGVAKGRRCDNPTAFCVGTLTHVPNMDYALQRRKTLAWCGGFVWGEYCDEESVLWLHLQPQGMEEWRTPSV